MKGDEYEAVEKRSSPKLATREHRDDGPFSSSASLADRLLQGWTMLSKTCPTPHCHTPLMRDHTGSELCVTCGPVTVGEGAHLAPGVTRGRALHHEEKGQVGVPDEVNAAPTFDAHHRFAEQNTGDTGHALASVAVPTSPKSLKSLKSLESLKSLDHARVKSKALDALYNALDVSRQRLETCMGATSMNVEEGARVADLMTKLAHAAKALSDLSS